MKENICICIVCLKTFSTSITNETATAASPQQVKKCEVSLLTKFLKFAKNYLQIPSHKLLNVNGCASGKVSFCDMKDAFCEKCELAVITPICQVYLEFLSAQLRLSWELEQLGKLLESSPLDKFDNDNKLGVANIKLLTEQLGIESVSDLEEFRSLLSHKCKLKRKLALPDVLIEPRCEHDSDDDIDHHHEIFEPLHSEEASNPIDFELQDEGDNPRHDKNGDVHGFFEIESDAIKLESVDLPNNDHYILHDGKQDDDDVRNQLKFEEVVLPELFEDEVEIQHRNVVEPPPRTHTQTPEGNSVASNNKKRKHFSSSQCNKIYVTARGLRLHCAKVHSQPAQEFKCPICAKGFAKRRTMVSHKYNVHNKKSFSCSQCSVVYTSNWRLQLHIKAVHNPETHVCVECNRVFPTIQHLKRHCERTHPQPGQEFKCPICANGFTTKYKMWDHKRWCHKTKRRS